MRRFKKKRSKGQPSLASRVLSVLTGGVALSTTEIARILKAPKKQVQSRLSELRRKKLVERYGNAWRLPGMQDGLSGVSGRKEMRIKVWSSFSRDAYKVIWHFEGKVIGSVPLDYWLVQLTSEARGLKLAKCEPLPMDSEVGPDLVGIEPPELIRIVTGFEVWNGLLTLPAETIKAHLKDCALQLWMARQITPQAFWALVGNSIYVQPHAIPLRKEGRLVTEADGWHGQVTYLLTPQGPCYVSTLSQYVVGPSIEFGLLVRKSAIREEDLDKLLFLAGSTATAASGPWGRVDIPVSLNISTPSYVSCNRSLN